LSKVIVAETASGSDRPLRDWLSLPKPRAVATGLFVIG